MELMQWFFMGVLFTVGVFGLSYLSLRVKPKWYAWAGLIIGIVAILFGIGWAGGLVPGRCGPVRLYGTDDFQWRRAHSDAADLALPGGARV